MRYTKREINAQLMAKVQLVIEALHESTGKQIWRLKERDIIKLYRLWQFSQMYCVPLTYVWTTLLGYFAKGVEKRTGVKSKGIGVNLNVLAGSVAEDVLQKAVAKDYVDGENIVQYREEEQDKIVHLMLAQDNEPGITIRSKVKSTLDYPTLRAATDAVIHSIRRKTMMRDKISQQFKKLPFRNNPYR